MLTRIDHTVISVSDLDDGVAAFRRLGFHVSDGGVNVDDGGQSAFAYFDDEYLELTTSPRIGHGVGDSGAERDGLRTFALRSNDLDGDVNAMRARGVDVSDVFETGIRTRTGVDVRWRRADLHGKAVPPLTFVEHVTPLADRQRLFAADHAHMNTAVRPERAYIAVPDVREVASEYSGVLDLPVPDLERGTVIMSLMAVFYLGSTGIALAEPFGAGVTADALATWGQGPFQIIFRTRSIDAAVRWIEDHGLPSPTRGVRLSGEHAVLVQPEHACGTYIAFAGPA